MTRSFGVVFANLGFGYLMGSEWFWKRSPTSEERVRQKRRGWGSSKGFLARQHRPGEENRLRVARTTPEMGRAHGFDQN